MQGLCLKYAEAALAASGESSQLGSPLGFTQVSHPTGSIASMSASIRDRLIALALYRMASATPEADEAHPQSHSNANPISLFGEALPAPVGECRHSMARRIRPFDLDCT